MNSEIQKECFKTADKILNILDELEYVSEKVPAYPNLLRDLIAIEVKRNITNSVTLFYNSVAIHPIETVEEAPSTDLNEGGCCGGGCGCHDNDEELPPPEGFDDPANPRND